MAGFASQGQKLVLNSGRDARTHFSLTVAQAKETVEVKDTSAAVNTPELRFNCDDVRKFAVIEEVAARLRTAGARVHDADGVRVNTDDGWWLLRASNTQAVLVARAEASSAAGLDRLKAALVTQLEASGLAVRRSRPS